MEMGQVRVGIAGLGYWGPNLLRNLRSIQECRVAGMSDLNEARVAEFLRLYPDVTPYATAEELIDSPDIDAVVLALPAKLLPPLTHRAIERGKHILIEKPMASSIEDGVAMAEAAAAADTVSMVDFTFVYNAAVRYLRGLLESQEMGSPLYYQSTRINLGRFQPDVGVIWDLAVHDIAILAFLLGQDPVSVTSTGRGIREGRLDTAHVTLTYDDGFQAFIHVSWMAPTKVRMALLACSKGMAVYNDVEPDEKIRLFNLEEQFDPGSENSLVPTFRLGDVLIPRLVQEEALRVATDTFVGAINGGDRPITDFSFGVRVLSVLEAARLSVDEKGPVPVQQVLPRQAVPSHRPHD